MWRRASAAVVGVIAVLLVAGCGEQQRPDYPKRQTTAGTAVLPPTPDLNPKLPPAQYDDGAWSVHGVLQTGSKLPKEGLKVRGFVAAMHSCPDPTQRCNPAPFLQLTDAKSLQGRRLLVGGAIDPKRDGLKVGETATLSGKFVTRSADGLYFAPGGMLLFELPTADPDAEGSAAKKAK